MRNNKQKLSPNQKEEIFEQCLDRISSGENLESVLEFAPQWQDELRQLLEAAQALSWLADSTIVPDSLRERSLDDFLLAARTARSLRPERYIMAAPAKKSWIFGSHPLLRNIFYVLLLLVIILVGVGLTVSASADALPGEPLYPIKLLAEDARLWLERDQSIRLAMIQDTDQERGREIQELLDQTRQDNDFEPVEVTLVGVLSKPQADSWLVNGYALLFTPDTQIVGQIEDGLVVEMDGILGNQGVILVHRAEIRQYELSGVITQINSGEWEINRVRFAITPQTLIQGDLSSNENAVVVLVDRGNGSYEARLIQVDTATPSP